MRIQDFWRVVPLVLLLVFLIRAEEIEKEPVGQNLILLLIDGYGASLYNRTDPKLQNGAQMLIKNGVQAEYLKPVFPSQSYPNWFSLNTGLYVENHNFTADFMYDPKRDVYFQRDEGANDTDYQWWSGGPDPIWYTAGKKHVDVHCYWYANCHRPHGDMMVQVPKTRQHSFKNEKSYDLFAYLPRIMKHIKKYQVYRQQLVLLRYNGLSKALRLFGDDSDAGKQALASADAQIRKIQEEMESHELFDSTNLIVLSDHGLKRISEDHQFFLEECLTDITKIKRVVNNLAFTFVYPEPEAEDSVYFELRVCDQWAAMGDYDDEDEPSVAVYRKNEIPEKYHWKGARFIAPIVLVAKPGAVILTTQIPSTDVSEAQGRELRMIGGWDNEEQDLSGIFMARGPAFKQDYKASPLDLVDVYQLALNIIGVEAGHPHNGSWEHVEELLADGWEDRQVEPDGEMGLLPSLTLTLVALISLWHQ
ncbi:unnamed protein product [Bursaphelenchus xylophilus]|uniref:(pine wood nematode) hypothetical protein n=1 Tax=Bursaphelenchus xylophilus TaxID=6326 RepID=A0A1I7SSW3_BURXY|nr:unnamed protein product [Bursaphelenchus xylophilus]CAG9108858.1 unnamed protein product [Bursaphelenchus xylophilus]